MQYWRSARIHFTVCSSSVWGGQDLRCSSGWFHHSSLKIQLLVWMRMSVDGHFSPEKLLWVHIKDLAVLLKDTQRSLGLFVCWKVNLGGGPEPPLTLTVLMNNIWDWYWACGQCFLQIWHFEPSISVSSDQRKLFAIVWESFRLHLCFVFTLTCTLRP